MHRSIHRSPGPFFALSAAALVLLAAGTALGDRASAGWPQWGGPHQNFVADSAGLASSWPEAGPTKLWSRELGDGYSAILEESGRLYTMFREGTDEVVIAMGAADGETVWEHRYEASPGEGHVTQFGEGPRSTPLISGDRIYSIGVSGKMHCLNKKDGSLVWAHDLWEEFGGNFLNHGYSTSPISYQDTVIVLVGGEGSSIVAFHKKDGSVAWKSLDFQNSYSTPRVLRVNGEDQLVAFMAAEAIGVDPSNGKLKWQFAVENQWRQNINMPTLVGNDLLFVSSLQAGSRGLKIGDGGAEEVWSTRKIQFYHVNTVQIGDYIYGSTGGSAPNFMAAINAKTGEIAWRKRGFAKANIVAADGKLVILDENGMLYLASASPEDLVVHAETQLLERVAWTVPTIVGTTLFVRDKSHLIAVDLG